jgi:two-component system cell cycle response regulator DivK
MDVGLGEFMDGWETTQRIKANPLTRLIPVIALTASAFASDRIRSLAAGCCDFDTKSVDLARLLSKIDNALNGSRAPAIE